MAFVWTKHCAVHSGVIVARVLPTVGRQAPHHPLQFREPVEMEVLGMAFVWTSLCAVLNGVIAALALAIVFRTGSESFYILYLCKLLQER